MKFTMYYVCVYRNGDLREKYCVRETDTAFGHCWPRPITDLIHKLSQRFGWDGVEYRITQKPDVYAETCEARYIAKRAKLLAAKDDEMAKDRNIKKGNKKPKLKTLKDKKREKREKREKEKKQI